ncbi:hypothetical protein Tco_1031022, partial [Tanacetum coccineum]
WKTECLGTKPQVDKAEHLEEINQNVLVMDKYQDEIPRGFDKVLWGDLMVMFNPDDEDKFVKKLLAELKPEDSDGDEEDL